MVFRFIKKIFYKAIYGQMWGGNISINTNRIITSNREYNVKSVESTDIKFLMSGQLNPTRVLDSNVDDNLNLFDTIQTEFIQVGG